MFTDLQTSAGGVNRFSHNRRPAAIDKQTVIRLNRDTLYSFAVVDVSQGAGFRIPPHGDRYLSVMVVDENHFITDVFHGEGEYSLEAKESAHVLLAARVLVGPDDPADIEEASVIQDGITVHAASSRPFESEDYDPSSFDETRDALLDLARNLRGFDHMFGRREEVDAVRHLIGTAAGWGGLPTSEAAYEGVGPRLPVGRYELTVGEVPVDGFWSISVYNAKGYFEPNDRGVYSVNSVTAVRNDDGTTTVRFGERDEDVPNVIPLPEGWNYMVRMYRPRPEILDGTWRFPRLSDLRATDPAA